MLFAIPFTLVVGPASAGRCAAGVFRLRSTEVEPTKSSMLTYAIHSHCGSGFSRTAPQACFAYVRLKSNPHKEFDACVDFSRTHKEFDSSLLRHLKQDRDAEPELPRTGNREGEDRFEYSARRPTPRRLDFVFDGLEFVQILITVLFAVLRPLRKRLSVRAPAAFRCRASHTRQRILRWDHATEVRRHLRTASRPCAALRVS